MKRAVSRPHKPDAAVNVVQAARKGVPNRNAQTATHTAHRDARNPRRVSPSNSGFFTGGAGFCGMTSGAAAVLAAPGFAVAGAAAAVASTGRPSRAAFSISCTEGRLPAGFNTGAAPEAAFGAAGLLEAALSAPGCAPPAPVWARAAARMSFVDFGDAAPGAGTGGGAFATPGPAVWARAAAKMSFVDLGAPEGLVAAEGEAAAVGAAAADTAGAAGGTAAAAGGVLAAGASTGPDCEAGDGPAAPPLLPVWARAAFRISSVESFFAIFSSRDLQRSTGAGGVLRMQFARRCPAGSACRFGRILSAASQPVHSERQSAKRFPISRNDVTRAFPALRSDRGKCITPVTAAVPKFTVGRPIDCHVVQAP